MRFRNKMDLTHPDIMLECTTESNAISNSLSGGQAHFAKYTSKRVSVTDTVVCHVYSASQEQHVNHRHIYSLQPFMIGPITTTDSEQVLHPFQLHLIIISQTI